MAAAECGIQLKKLFGKDFGTESLFPIACVQMR